MDRDGDGTVTMEEYQIHVLKSMGMVQEPLLRSLEKNYDKMTSNLNDVEKTFPTSRALATKGKSFDV
jgi:hypothetical protein